MIHLALPQQHHADKTGLLVFINRNKTLRAILNQSRIIPQDSPGRIIIHGRGYDAPQILLHAWNFNAVKDGLEAAQRLLVHIRLGRIVNEH